MMWNYTFLKYVLFYPVCKIPCEKNNIIKSIMNKQMIYKIYQKNAKKCKMKETRQALPLSSSPRPSGPLGLGFGFQNLLLLCIGYRYRVRCIPNT